MNPKLIKELLRATPFVPFTVVLVSGETHHVYTPDVLIVTLQGQVIFQDFAGPTRFINPASITEILRPGAAA